MGNWALRTLRAAAGLIFVLLCLAVAAYAFAYLYGDFRPRNPFDRRFALAGLAVPAHLFGAGLALALAPLQLWQGLRNRVPRAHRLVGWLYAFGVLIGGLGGLALAPNAHAGWASGAGFLLLALVWLATTGLGIGHAVAGRFGEHRRWMLRSVALTAAAITLRLTLAVGQGALHLPFATVYVFAAWSCWTVNLLVVELWLRRAGTAARQGPAVSVAAAG